MPESGCLGCPPMWLVVVVSTILLHGSASEPVTSGCFASCVDSGAAPQQISVKAWEPSSVTFYQKTRRVHEKLILDLMAIGKLEMYHMHHCCWIFSTGRSVKPCKLCFYLSVDRIIWSSASFKYSVLSVILQQKRANVIWRYYGFSEDFGVICMPSVILTLI